MVGTLVMAERIETGSTFLRSDSIAQMTSFTWIGLAFLVVVPLLLGHRHRRGAPAGRRAGIAYPRAAALSFWGWLFAGGVMVERLPGQRRARGRRRQAVDLFLVSLSSSWCR